MPGWAKGVLASVASAVMLAVLGGLWFAFSEAQEHEEHTQPLLAQVRQDLLCIECERRCMSGCMVAGTDHVCRAHCKNECSVVCGGSRR